MALNTQNNIAVFHSAVEALSLTWARCIPYVVLALLMALPMVASYAVGLFDSFADHLSQLSGGEHTVSFQGYPFGTMLVSWVIGWLALVAFGIFWHRYILLGADGALRFGFAQFNGMFWRSAGYGLVVMLVGLVTLFVAGAIATLLGGLLFGVLGGGGGIAVVAVSLAGYVLPLALVVRLSLIFPALALGERMSFAGSWSATKGSTWRIVGTILILVIPSLLISQAIYFGLFFGLFGINMLDPAQMDRFFDNWWLSLLLAPVLHLPSALVLATVAIAYRDLSSRPEAEPSADMSYAR